MVTVPGDQESLHIEVGPWCAGGKLSRVHFTSDFTELDHSWAAFDCLGVDFC